MLTTEKDSHHGPLGGTFVTSRSLGSSWVVMGVAEANE
jgi:hypothetical protein